MNHLKAAIVVILVIVAAVILIKPTSVQTDTDTAVRSVETLGQAVRAPQGEHSPKTTRHQDFTGQYQLSGRVVFQSSRLPADGATVVLRTQPSEKRAGITFAGSDGRFHFTVENTGYYQLTAALDGWVMVHPLEVLIDEETNALTNLELQLDKGVRIMVKVVAADTGHPLKRAEILVRDMMARAITTDRRGEAQVFLIGDRLSIRVEARGYTPATREIAVESQTNHITIALQPAGEFNGRVVDSLDRPIIDAIITIEEDSGDWKRQFETDSEGLFFFRDFPLNTPFNLTIWKQGMKPLEENGLFTSPDSPFLQKKLVMYPQEKERVLPYGVVMNQLGEPIGKALVTLSHRRGRESLETYSDADGYYQFDTCPFSLKWGDLTVKAEGYALWRRLTRRMSYPNDVILSEGSWLAGRVVNANNEGLGNVAIFSQGIFEPLSQEPLALSDMDGNFYLSGLSDMQKLLFYKPGYAPRPYRPKILNRDAETVVLEEEGVLVGFVKDAESEEPIPQFEVKPLNSPIWVKKIHHARIAGSGDQLEVHNERGRFYIHGLIPNEILDLRISAPGYPPKDFSFVIPKRDETEDRNFLLEPGDYQLTLGIQNTEGEPLAGVLARLLAVTPPMKLTHWKDLLDKASIYRNQTSDESGLITFHGLPANRSFGLVIEGEGFTRKLLEAPPPTTPEEAPVHWITLTKEARIYGYINREAYPNATQIFSNSNHKGYKTELLELTPDQETYEMNGLPQGDITLTLAESVAGSGGVSFSEQRTVSLKEGQSYRLDFGDKTQFRVEGYAISGGNAMPRQTLFLLQGTAWKKTVTSANGHFVFDEVESGEYQLVASWIPNPEAVGQAGLLANYPNQHPINVEDRDINDSFIFQAFGALYGYIPPQGNWRVQLEGVMTNGGRHFRSQDPEENGFFSFPNLAPGTYQIGRYPTGYPADYEVLLANIIMPEGGEDLNVGRLKPDGNGKVRVIVETPGEQYNWQFKIKANPLFQTPGNPVARSAVEKNVFRAPEEILLSNLGKGTYEIEIEAVNNQAFKITPNTIQIDPDPQNPSIALFTIQAGTWLDIVAKDPEVIIASARLVREGQTVNLQAWPGPDQPYPVQGEEVALFYQNICMVRNLPRGDWTLEVIDSRRRTHHQRVHLETGREKQIALEFN